MSETLLADLEAEYTREAVRLSQPALHRVMDATRPADTTLRHRRITITLRTPSSSGPVAIEHDSALIGQADHNDAVRGQRTARLGATGHSCWPQASCPWLSWAGASPFAVGGLGEADAVAQRTAESNGYAEEVQPQTQTLFDQITATRRAASSGVDG